MHKTTEHHYTCLKAKFQVVLCDYKIAMAFTKKKKAKVMREGTLPPSSSLK